MLVETESHINCVHLPQDSVCSVCSRMWHRYVNILPRFVLSTFIIVFPCASVTRLHTSPLATFASCAHCWFRTIHKMLTYPPYSHLQHISHIFTIQQQQQQTAQRGSQNPISTRKLESARVAPCCNSHWRNSHHHSEAVETTDVEHADHVKALCGIFGEPFLCDPRCLWSDYVRLHHVFAFAVNDNAWESLMCSSVAWWGKRLNHVEPIFGGICGRVQ